MPRPQPNAEHVDEKLVNLLWERGIDHTSVADIVAEAGISRAYIYQRFGSREGLVHHALKRYSEGISADMLQKTAGRSGLAGLEAFLRALDRLLACPIGNWGCLATHSAGAAPHDDGVSHALNVHHSMYLKTFTTAFGEAIASGELNPGLPAETCARLWVAQIQGLFTDARRDTEAALALLAAMRALLVSWAGPRS